MIKKLFIRLFLIYPGLYLMAPILIIKGYIMAESQRDQCGYYPEYEDLKKEVIRQYEEKYPIISIGIWFFVLIFISL